MSLILEALKKSEARRQLGEAPGIGTPFSVAPRRRNALPLIVVLILVAAGFGWWYLRTAPVPAGKSAAPDTTTASPKAPSATTPASASATSPATVTAYPQPATPASSQPGLAKPDLATPRAPNTATNAAPTQPMTVAPHALNDRASVPQNPRGDLAQRTVAAKPGVAGVDTVPPPGGFATGPRPAFGQRRTAPAPAPPETGLSAAARNAAAVEPVPPPATAPVAKAELPANPVPPAAAPAPAPAQPAATTAPNMTSYYNLPFEVRKDLPPLAISMHVYAAVPAQRFIVIDGERKTEGETLKDGLTLREIRLDGAVFDFRGQVFFYPRPGR